MILQQTEYIEFVKSLVSSFPSGIVAFDLEGYITIVNAQFVSIMKQKNTISEITDLFILDVLPKGKLRTQVALCLDKGRSTFDIPMLRYKNQSYDVKGVKLLNGMLLVMNDITPLVDLKNEATDLIIQSQELERTRIAKEMHDGIGPTLSTIRLGIERIAKSTTDENTKEHLSDVTNSIVEISREIRSISHDLMPSSIVDFGLITALENFVLKTNPMTEFEINLNIDMEENGLVDFPNNCEVNIFRIIQEATNNAIKYANCENLNITFSKHGHVLNLQIGDDGVGYITNEKSEGIGLINMKTRVNSMKGTIDIKSELNKGVTIFIKLPMIQS